MRWRVADQMDELWDNPEFVATGLLHDINEQILSQVRALGLRNSQLAERLGVSRAYINKLLDGNPNLTVRSLARIALALGCEPSITLRPRRSMDIWRVTGAGTEFEVINGAEGATTENASSLAAAA